MTVYSHRVRQERLSEVAGATRRLEQTWSTIARYEARVAPLSASARDRAAGRGQRVDYAVLVPVDSAANWSTSDRVAVEDGPPGIAGLTFDVESAIDHGLGVRLLVRRRV